MKKILDYGCGKGYFAHYLASTNNGQIYGVDISEENIEYGKKHFPEVNYVLSKSLPLPFSDGYFDEIYMWDVLEHVDDLPGTLNEVTRLLDNKGRLTINVPAEASEKWLLKIRPTYHQEIHHVRIFKEGEMENILQSKGFSLIKKRYEGFLENFALYYLFKTSPKSSTQLAIGDWNRNWISKIVFVLFLLFSKKVLTTRLRYFPIWIITLPFGMLIDYFGNKSFPKSQYYEFIKH